MVKDRKEQLISLSVPAASRRSTPLGFGYLFRYVSRPPTLATTIIILAIGECHTP